MISDLLEFSLELILVNKIYIGNIYLCKNYFSFPEDYLSSVLLIPYFLLIEFVLLFLENIIVFFITPISIQNKVLVNEMRDSKVFQNLLSHNNFLLRVFLVHNHLHHRNVVLQSLYYCRL